MLYHLMLATTGLAVLLGGWLLVQRLAGMQTGDPAGLDCTVPNTAANAASQSVTACGGCVACGPANADTHWVRPLARDGPAAGSVLIDQRP